MLYLNLYFLCGGQVTNWSHIFWGKSMLAFHHTSFAWSKNGLILNNGKATQWIGLCGASQKMTERYSLQEPPTFWIFSFPFSFLSPTLSFCSSQFSSKCPIYHEIWRLAWILTVVVRTPKVRERWTLDLIFLPLIKWTYMTWSTPGRKIPMVPLHWLGACWALQIFEMSIHLIMSSRLKDQGKKNLTKEQQNWLSKLSFPVTSRFQSCPQPSRRNVRVWVK